MTEETENQVPDEEVPTPEREEDLTLQNINSVAAVVHLGKVAGSQLLSFGTCTLIADEQGYIRVLNPHSVFVDSEAAHPPEGVEPVFVRPILTNRRPQFVARKEDGSLWEVEYQDSAEEDGS